MCFVGIDSGSKPDLYTPRIHLWRLLWNFNSLSISRVEYKFAY